MAMYPSLEDMKVDQMMKAQMDFQQQRANAAISAPPNVYPTGMPNSAPYQPNAPHLASIYPTFDDFMGLDLTPEMISHFTSQAAQVPPQTHPPQDSTIAVCPPGPIQAGGMIAPLSSNSLGLQRAQVTHGLRELCLCKDEKGRVGVSVRDVNKGIFVSLIQKNSPAAQAGLRFGDQLLQVNGETLAGYSMDKVHKIFRNAAPNNIMVVVRDRPFERTLTMHKDSGAHIGFGFKNGKITMLVKDSSAARNGMLTEQNLLEVNGQNVVGLPDKDITKLIDAGGKVITVTIMPSILYEHMMKNMASSFIRKEMDHRVPDM